MGEPCASTAPGSGPTEPVEPVEPTEPIELFRLQSDGTPVSAGLFACGVCRKMPLTADKAKAEVHCICSGCGCSVIGLNYLRLCPGCSFADREKKREAREAKEKQRLDEAELVSDDGDTPVVIGDDYFATMDDLVDHLECTLEEGDEWPERAHVCSVVPCLRHDFNGILEILVDELPEDYTTDCLSGATEFEAAYKKFIDANESLVYWLQDNKRAMKVPAPREE